jgi:hypothetical protein
VKTFAGDGGVQLLTRLLVIGSVCFAFGAPGQEQLPKREMNVRQGPESVFDRPPTEILPALAGAKATGENGRVGSELVFWGYEHSDGRRIFFFACALRPEVDCATRVPAICPTTTTVLETREASGKTVRRNCRNISVVGAGDTRPGCDDRTQTAGMAVGLVSCG